MLQTLDFLYVFNFHAPYFADALERLKYSIKSINDQDVNICISNNSPICIHDEVAKIIGDFRYKHTIYKGPFSRALGINYAVRNLVETEYFLISDIDLVYSRDHVQRLKLKVESLAPNEENVRVINYNYNLKPVLKKSTFVGYASKTPFIRRFFSDDDYYTAHPYSSDFTILDQLPKSPGGFAHGNGLIHTESFMKIRGYDEEMIGYGPEDTLFNLRIGKINRLIYDNLQDTASFHLWHPRFHMIQFEKNMQIWRDRAEHYNSLDNIEYQDVMGNVHGHDWGVI